MDRATLIIFPLLLVALGGVWYFMSREPAAVTPDTFAYSTTTTSGAPPAASAEQSSPQAVQQQTDLQPNPSNPSGQASQNIMQATLHTNQGDVTIEFFGADAPKTVENFTKLANGGFYNGTKFHRVIKGFMIQGGDPLSKDDAQAARWGTGGPGYQFADEIRANNKNNIGTIAMANSGPGTNGSQFFINAANNNFLDSKHTTFGRVTAGMEVVAAIEGTPVGANDRPVEPMVITSITLN